MKMKKAKKRGEGSNFVGVYFSYARYKKKTKRGKRKRWGLKMKMKKAKNSGSGLIMSEYTCLAKSKNTLF